MTNSWSMAGTTGQWESGRRELFITEDCADGLLGVRKSSD